MGKRGSFAGQSFDPADKVIRAQPPVEETGNNADDADGRARTVMFENLIRQMLIEESHILSLHNSLEEHKAIREGGV